MICRTLIFFTIGGDGIDLVIDLREGVLGNSGVEFNAESFKRFIEYVVRSAPENSLIKKQWGFLEIGDTGEVLVSVLDEYKVSLKLQLLTMELNIIDFIYSLASPIAGIACIPNGGSVSLYPVDGGTGAYHFTTAYSDNTTEFTEITLQRNEDWWALDIERTENDGYWWRQNAPTEEYIRFEYEQAGVQVNNLSQGDIDIAICDAKYYYDSFNNGVQGYVGHTVAGNPMLLRYNPDSEIGANKDVRWALATFLSDDNNSKWNWINENENASLSTDPYGGLLSNEAHGLWALDTRTNDIEDAKTTIDDYGYIDVDGSGHIMDVNVLIPETQEESTGYYEFLIICMNQIVSNYGIVFHPYYPTVYEQEETYDLMFTEVNVCNINSVYNTLYDEINDEVDQLLYTSIFPADYDTYTTTHAYIQSEIHKHVYAINLGWRNKIYLLKNGVSGFSVPQTGFNTTGDINRLDFRWISKAA